MASKFDPQLPGILICNAVIVTVGIMIALGVKPLGLMGWLMLALSPPIVLAVMAVLAGVVLLALFAASLGHGCFSLWTNWRRKNQANPSLIELCAVGAVIAVPIGLIHHAGTDLLLEDFARVYLLCACLLFGMACVEWLFNGGARAAMAPEKRVWPNRGVAYVYGVLMVLPLAVYSLAQTSRLHEAVASKDRDRALRALKPWKSINARDKHGRTPLAIAIGQRDIDMAKLLFERGAQPYLRRADGTVEYMLISLYYRNYGILKALDRASLPKEIKDQHLGSALIESATTGITDAVRALLDAGAPVNFVSSNGETAIFCCFGETPLRRNRKAASEIAQILAERGATLTIVTKSGQTLFDKVLVGDPSGKLDAQDLNLLLDLGYPPEFHAPKQPTPLFEVARGRYVGAVSILLHRGADPNDGGIVCGHRNCAGRATALHAVADLPVEDVPRWPREPAAAMGPASTAIARLLLSRGANPDVTDHHGATPLDLAVKTGNFDVARLLLEYGADAKKQGPSLVRGAQRFSPQLVELLLKAGACSNDGCPDLKARSK